MQEETPEENMPKQDTVSKSMNFAQKIIAQFSAKPEAEVDEDAIPDLPAYREKNPVKTTHSYNYVTGHMRRPRSFEPGVDPEDENSEVIYTTPGKARSVQIVPPPVDARAGLFPIHNSKGEFEKDLQLLRSIDFNDYKGILTSSNLDELGYRQEAASLTNKRYKDLHKQFVHFSEEAFQEMLCMEDPKQRDFEIWVKKEEAGDLENTRGLASIVRVAFINQELDLIQFIQVIGRDANGKVVNLQQIVFDAGDPLVINESLVDDTGRLRQVAHVGTWGQKSDYLNSVERFDDATVLWTLTEYQGTKRKNTKDELKFRTGTAAMKESGEILILSKRISKLEETAARNLGAEGIDPLTQKWTGRFSREGCKPEDKDKFVARSEYKQKIRAQVFQIIDGAAIPGLMPIFDF